MGKVNDGGPAFPLPGESKCNGMSLRDYFAIHCDQPGVTEITCAAGYFYRGGKVWLSEDKNLGSFNEWFESLTQERRFALYAQVRYGLADAMLAERSK